MNKKFSIVVQGPFDSYIYDKFNYPEHYLNYVDKVVISCYNTDDTTNLEKNITGNDRIILVKNDCPSFHCNPCNMYVHSFSTLKGLEQVETEFTIKIRANQFYSQIDKIINLVENNPDKYTVCNINTYQVDKYSLKISDHLFAAKTEALLSVMKQTMQWCHEANNAVDKHGHLGCRENASYGQTEHVFFLAYLKYKGYNLIENVIYKSNDIKRQIMKDNLVIFNINDLKPMMWSSASHNFYSDHFHLDDECIDSVEKL